MASDEWRVASELNPSAPTFRPRILSPLATRHSPLLRATMSTDYLTINGTQINLVAYECAIDRCTPYVRGGIPELASAAFSASSPRCRTRGAASRVSWSNGSSYPGTTYFVGDVVGYSDHYQARSSAGCASTGHSGLRNRADYVPVTDSNTLSDTASFNLPPDDIYAIVAREGTHHGPVRSGPAEHEPERHGTGGLRHRQLHVGRLGGAGTAVLTGTSVSSVTVA